MLRRLLRLTFHWWRSVYAPGQKLHEEMITVTDAMNTIDLGPYYAILPSVAFNHKYEDYVNHHNAVKVPEGFHYSSDTNTEWETVESMRAKK